MTRVFAIGAVLAAVLAGAASADFKRITTEAEYLAAMGGKTLVMDAGTFKIRKNGKLTGKLSTGEKVTGNWVWQKGFWCRRVAINGKDRGTDCQIIEIDGNKYRVSRNQGRGARVVGEIR